MFINFTGGGMNSPSGVGVDSTGNVWVASYFSAASEFSPTGNPIFPSGITSGGLYHSYGLAIDAQNNVWIPNEDSTASGVNGGLGSITVLNSSGQLISGAADTLPVASTTPSRLRSTPTPPPGWSTMATPA